MNYKNIELISKKYEEIKSIDEQIIKIEKRVNKIFSGECDDKFVVEIKSRKPQTTDVKPFTANGLFDMMNAFNNPFRYNVYSNDKNEKEDSDNFDITLCLNDREFIYMAEAIIRCKNTERKTLISNIRELLEQTIK